jgi:hypothetical protein
MGWVRSFVVAILTAVAGLFASGFVASLAVSWYRISSFEGGSGFFVVGLALLGAIAGFIVGFVAALLAASYSQPTFLKALGTSVTIVLLVAAVVGGTARLLADIPPEIDGEELFLLAEIRWPQGGAAPPASMPGLGVVRLGAASSAVVRVTEDGPLFLDMARQDGGRWVIPGAVRVFTSRGDRILDFRIGEKTLGGFIVPLPRHPGAESRSWSPWYPTARPGSPPLLDQFTYRYRVVRQSEPLRTDAVGPFDVDTMVQSFGHVMGSDEFAASSRFRVRHRASDIAVVPDATAVAIVGGVRPTLLVHQEQADRSGLCEFVSEEGGQARMTPAGPCTASIEGRVLTSDTGRFEAARASVVVPGWIDRVTFATPGLYRVSDSILDTRTLRTFTFEPPSSPSPVRAVPPLDVSPDERSFVWLALDGTEDQPRLVVTRFESGATYVLPIDRARMRYIDFDALTPAWVHHHFTWERRADGDLLVERPAFTPLPFQGRVTVGKPGAFQGYTLRPGSEALRAAMVAVLTTELGGVRLPDELNGYKQRVRLGSETLDVTFSSSSSTPDVTVSTHAGDPVLMKKVATRLDAALATGTYDDLFGQIDPSP